MGKKMFVRDKHENILFFLWGAPTHHSFTFNSQFLYELKHKVDFSKAIVGISIFDSVYIGFI